MNKNSLLIGEKEVLAGDQKYIFEGFTYESTIDDINNLYAKLAYKADTTSRLPLVVIMHGYIEEVSNITDDIFLRMADKDVAILAVGMRGRDGADGQPDASGRELYDIYDAINYVIDRYSIIDDSNVNIVGYSGGGGNALGMAVKFPDLFNTVTSHFGIVDYGYDEESGWYQGGTYPTERIENFVGSSPTDNIDFYKTRNALYGIGNYEGFVYLFHDSDDESVPVHHTLNLKSVLDNNGKENYFASITTEEDEIRWIHSLPYENEPVINSEDVWLEDVKNGKNENVNLAPSGSLIVSGYLVTDNFELWLGDGLDVTAKLNYDLDKDVFDLTVSKDTEYTLILANDIYEGFAEKSATTSIIIN